MKETRHLMYLSLLTTMSLVLSLVEKNIPIPFMTPGAKLGLANLVTVIALYTLPKKREVGLIILARLILVAIFAGSLMGLMYGSMGALLSWFMMDIVKEGLKEKVSSIGVSIMGAVFHHIGQLMIASLIVKNIGVFLYLPILTAVAIITGGFIGVMAHYMLIYFYKLPLEIRE